MCMDSELATGDFEEKNKIVKISSLSEKGIQKVCCGYNFCIAIGKNVDVLKKNLEFTDKNSEFSKKNLDFYDKKVNTTRHYSSG